MVIGAGTIVIKHHNVSAADADKDSIIIKMIYNNSGSHPDFKKEWGLAMWIEKNSHAVLFDTGGNAATLWKNLQTAGMDISKLTTIIISHNHWDHILGIPAILEKTSFKPVLYVPATDAADFRDKNQRAVIKPVSDAQLITDSIWTTGEMKGSLGNIPIHEQSLIVVRDDLAYIFTGCAHPGIIAIVEKAKTQHPGKEIALVAGGFHLLDQTAEQIQAISARLKDLQVKRIAPSHCTGDKAVEFFRKEWSGRFTELNIGNDLNI